MKKRNLMICGGVLVVGALAAAFATRSSWMGSGASAQGPQRPRTVSVELAKAERKPVPVDVDSIGTVTPISSVALKSRLETTIVAVHFEDGAKVNEGDLLFTLDSRQIDAQIEQAAGMLAKDQAQLEGAQRDLRRLQRPDRQGRHHPGQCRQRQDPGRYPDRHHQGRSGRAGQSEGPEELHQHPRPILGTDQRRQCEGRQFRPPGRYRAAGGHQPDGAGLCDLRHPAAGPGRPARSHGERIVQGDRDHPGSPDVGRRQGRHGRKFRGFHHRHGHRARRHGQRQRNAVAGHSGQYQARCPRRGRGDRSHGSSAAQPERQLRVRHAGRQGARSAGDRRPHLPGYVRHRNGTVRRRGRHRRRAIAAVGGHAGRSRARPRQGPDR